MRTASRLDARASSPGSDDALAGLERDHRRVDTLFARALLTTSGDCRHELTERIAEELTAHAELEEQVVYPAIAQVLTSAPWLVDAASAEHDEMRALIGQLQSATDDATILLSLRMLQIAVLAHVTVEEGEIFPAYRQAAPMKAWEELTERVASHGDADVLSRGRGGSR